MKLEKFVSDTLTQIVNGVSAAQEHAVQKGAFINPVTACFTSGSSDQIYDSNTGIPLERIEFDVHIMVSQETSTSDGSTVGEITVASGVNTGEQNTSSNRIKFAVSMLLPTTGSRS